MREEELAKLDDSPQCKEQHHLFQVKEEFFFLHDVLGIVVLGVVDQGLECKDCCSCIHRYLDIQLVVLQLDIQLVLQLDIQLELKLENLD
jgi:hypothetical protein